MPPLTSFFTPVAHFQPRCLPADDLVRPPPCRVLSTRFPAPRLLPLPPPPLPLAPPLAPVQEKKQPATLLCHGLGGSGGEVAGEEDLAAWRARAVPASDERDLHGRLYLDEGEDSKTRTRRKARTRRDFT
eukprot:767175-Hanusia_phi.AAC.12